MKSFLAVPENRPFAVAAAVVACTATLLGLADQANASAPNCSVSHSVHPYSDNSGGAWQLELDARCNEQSGAFAIRWTFQFWAETYDGSRITEYFNGSISGGEERVRDGRSHYVGTGAPLGRPRYCYNAVVTFHGLTGGPNSGVPEQRTGTHCRNA